MRSRIAVSLGLILIAAVVTAQHGTGLLKELRLLHGSCAVKTSEIRVLMNLKHVSAKPAPASAAAAISTENEPVLLHRSSSHQLFCSRVRSLREFVLKLIN